MSALVIMSAVSAPAGKGYSRGVGLYPRNPAEDFPPVLVPDLSTGCNPALLRPACHTDSYDCDLNAKPVTTASGKRHRRRRIFRPRLKIADSL